MSLKVDGFVKPFKGKHDDWDMFWVKFQVIGECSGWDTEEKLMKRLPLFLESDALLVYSKMPTDDKKDKAKVVDVMKKTFGVSPGDAYRQFSSRRYRLDETPEAYVADLRRLLSAAGHSGDGDDNAVIIEQLLAGLPVHLERQIRLSCAGVKFAVPDIVSKVRALAVVDSSRPYTGMAAAASGSAAPRGGSSSGGTSASGQAPKAKTLCYLCNEPGHIRRNCPKRTASRGTMQCVFCDRTGHVKKDCFQRKKWLEAQSANGVSAASVGGADKVLCLQNHARGGLPRIYTDVSSPGGSCYRATAIVDTGSTRTLISRALLAHLPDVQLSRADSESTILALDGKPLDVLGSAQLQFHRNDGPVRIPRTCVDVLVVPNLSVVAADVLLGNDLVARCGGVSVSYDDDGSMSRVVFGEQLPAAAAAAGPVTSTDAAIADTASKLSRHVSVSQDGDDVVLSVDDGEARWVPSKQCWVMSWRWKEDTAPVSTIGSGITEYGRKHLSPQQEEKFTAAVDEWVANGWLIEHNPEVHGKPACVLPLMAVEQEHKLSTPVRPVLDYRHLNRQLVSHPGNDSPVCAESLRSWRSREDEHELLDIRKAYLQVHVRDDLLRYQVVVWQDKTYVMTRMGFGLSVAPKVMDIIVKYVTRDMPEVDNYVDDVIVPKPLSSAVSARLAAYGLPTKPAEDVSSARVLGLQLFTGADNELHWRRRDGVQLEVADEITRREVFSWCGRLTSHYPVCSWLRPACGYLKRLASVESAWDKPVCDAVVHCCAELQAMLDKADPATGKWAVNVEARDCTVWCDASDVAYGALLECDGAVVEDRSWLRPASDRRHINVAELNAVLRGLTLATDYRVKTATVVTDSKTVYGWLSARLGNIHRVKTNSLFDVVVERRLQAVEDIVAETGMQVHLRWVPSAENKADKLTRVPDTFVRCWRKLQPSASPAAASAAVSAPSRQVVSAVLLQDVLSAQHSDEQISSIIAAVSSGSDIVDPAFKKLRTQLLVSDGGLYRRVKVPPNDEQVVPVVPQSLQRRVLSRAHAICGHANWETTWKLLRSGCYFPNMAALCQSVVQSCSACAAASSKRGPVATPTRPVSPSGPWSVVQLDTLELGPNRSQRYHCVLVCTDMFTRWVEVVPLARHDGASVASAFVDVCSRWGAPDVVRSDNGTEFVNHVTVALYNAFGVEVRRGAVRHPQSQGGVERFHRTLLTLIRKTITESDDWASALSVLLYYYRVRPHSVTGLSPCDAMCGWIPRELSAAEASLPESAASAPVAPCPYSVGDSVLLLRPSRRQKRTSPYEPGWVVSKVVSESTVVIVRDNDDARTSNKLVNIELIKSQPTDRVDDDDDALSLSVELSAVDDGVVQPVVAAPVEPVPARVLRPRADIQLPVRYRD
eukprot:scpid18689/ scgid1770/ Gag-Pol polyprotein; Matrix protein p10; p20; Capsid protein p25; Nucleocapsid protein p14; Protease p15; Reverse transcriptase/ribonuclease H p90; Integrase p46